MQRTNINIPAAVEMLLNSRYLSEFEAIDGIRQHPDGVNFHQWLFQRGLISRDGLIDCLVADQVEFVDHPEHSHDCNGCGFETAMLSDISEIIGNAINARGDDLDHAAEMAASEIMGLVERHYSPNHFLEAYIREMKDNSHDLETAMHILRVRFGLTEKQV